MICKHSVFIPVLLALVLGVSSCADLRSVIEKDQANFNDVINALEHYHIVHGVYPPAMPFRLIGRNTVELPVLKQNTIEAIGPTYSADATGHWYCLRFGREWNGDVYCAYYVSFQKAWQVKRYPPDDFSINQMFRDRELGRDEIVVEKSGRVEKMVSTNAVEHTHGEKPPVATEPHTPKP